MPAMFRTLFLRLVLSAAIALVGGVLGVAVTLAMKTDDVGGPIYIGGCWLGGLGALFSLGSFIYGLATMADKKTDHLQR